MDGNFIFLPIKYAIPIPIRIIPIPISSPKLLPFPWESHGNPMHTSSVDTGRVKTDLGYG